MNLAFQVFYREAGVLKSLPVRAGDKDEARGLVEDCGLEVLNVGPGEPVLDRVRFDVWLNIEEAAAYINASVPKIHAMMAAGDLPRETNGRPRFKKSMLDEAIRKKEAA